MDPNNIYAIIMAGGKGERFWPQSRASHPKQLLRLIGNLTLIEQTVERLTPLVKHENIIIITNQDYVAPMRSLLGAVPPENIIGEPVGRDTAPCVALGTAIVKHKSGGDDDAVMMLLPADHVIKRPQAMLGVLKDCSTVASEGGIITIGVNPSFASTGYGYIHCGDKTQHNTRTSFFEGLGFKEKPSADVAERFLEDGNYRWNSGMFVWTVNTIYEAFKKHAPDLADFTDTLLEHANNNELEKNLAGAYENIKKISIDYAIMEKVDKVLVAECTFDWDDVGSWTALRNQIRPETNGNVVRGLHMGLDTNNCIIVGDPSHLVTTIDVNDLIIVQTSDATLICHTKSAQKIKELVHQLSDKPEMEKFL